MLKGLQYYVVTVDSIMHAVVCGPVQTGLYGEVATCSTDYNYRLQCFALFVARDAGCFGEVAA